MKSYNKSRYQQSEGSGSTKSNIFNIVSTETKISEKDKSSNSVEYNSKILLQNIKNSLLKNSKIEIKNGKFPTSERIMYKGSDMNTRIAADMILKEFDPYLRSEKIGQSNQMINFTNFSRVISKYAPPGVPAPTKSVLQYLFNSSCTSQDTDMADPYLFTKMLFDEGGVVINNFGFAQNISAVSLTRRPEVGNGPINISNIADLNITDIPYRYKTKQSRTSLAVPSDFDLSVVERSSRRPNYSLEKEHIFGFSSQLLSGNALLSLNENILIYSSAAVCIIHNISTNEQLFLEGHTDDITCITLSSDASFAASGQSGKSPYVCLWDINAILNGVKDFQISCRPYKLFGKGFFERAVCAVCISPDSKYIVAIGCNDHHSMGVWDISSGDLLCDASCVHGSPDVVKLLVWAPGPLHCNFISKEQQGVSHLLCTAGERHLKFWSFSPSSPSSIIGRGAVLGKKFSSDAKCYTCGSFSKKLKGDSITGSYDTYLGADDGCIYIYNNAVCQNKITVASGPSSAVVSMCILDQFIFCGLSKSSIAILSLRDYSVIESISVSDPDSEKGKAPLQMPTQGFKAKTTRPNSQEDNTFQIGISNEIKNRGVKQVKSTRVAWGGPKEDDRTPTVPKGVTASSNIIGITANLSVDLQSSTRPSSLSAYQIIVATGYGKSFMINLGSRSTGIQKIREKAPENGQSLLFVYHYGSVWGVKVFESPEEKFLFTCGDDSQLILWDFASKKYLNRAKLLAPGRCIDAIRNVDTYVAVGMVGGIISIYKLNQKSNRYRLTNCASRKDCLLEISDVKFSPDGRLLGVSSHDSYIDVYVFGISEGLVDLKPYKRLKGHTCYVKHFDWSADNSLIKSTCGSYELLYWEVRSGSQLLCSDDNVEADTVWNTDTCPVGFRVMGIWPACSDGTDCNSLDVAKDRGLVVTGDDFGKVKLFNYPCVVKSSPSLVGSGHSSHVLGVKFMNRGKELVSVGGNDFSVILWKLYR